MVRGVPDDGLREKKKKKYIHTYKKFTKNMKCNANDNLEWRHFGWNCRSVICSVQQYKWRRRSSWIYFKETTQWNEADKDISFFFRISSQQASILRIPCPVLAVPFSFQSLSSKTLMAASVSPSPSTNFKNVMVHSLGPGSGPSASSRALCSQISDRSSCVEILIMRVPFEDTFNTVRTNSSTSLNTLLLLV